MSDSLPVLEERRSQIIFEIAQLGDFRPGSICAQSRCARNPSNIWHPSPQQHRHTRRRSSAARGRNSNRPDGNRGGGAPSLPRRTLGASADQPVQIRHGRCPGSVTDAQGAPPPSCLQFGWRDLAERYLHSPERSPDPQGGRGHRGAGRVSRTTDREQNRRQAPASCHGAKLGLRGCLGKAGGIRVR